MSAYKDPKVFVPWVNAVTEPGFYTTMGNNMMDPGNWLNMMGSMIQPGAHCQLAAVCRPQHVHEVDGRFHGPQLLHRADDPVV